MVVKNMKNSNNNKNNNNASIKENSGSAVNDNDRINTNVNIKIDMGQPQIQKPKRRVKRKPKVQSQIPTQLPVKNNLAPVPLGATYMPSSSTYDTSMPAFRPTFESTRVPTGIDGGIIIPPPVAPIVPFAPALVAPEDGYRLGGGTPAFSDRGAMGSSAPPVFSRELTPVPVSREYTPMSVAPVSREITPMSAVSAMSRDSGVSQSSYGSEVVPYIPPPIGYLPETFTTYRMEQERFERPQLMSESREQSPLFPPRPLSTPRPPRKAIVTPVPRPSPIAETSTIIRPSFPTTPPHEIQELFRNQAEQGAKFNASTQLKRFAKGAINRSKLEKINNAVEVLQYQTREFLAKKRMREEDSRRLKALTTLQGYVRKQIQQPENISKNFLDSLIDDIEREVTAEERIQQFYSERGESGIREVRPEIAVKEDLSPSRTERSGATTFEIPSPSGTLSGFDERRLQRLREIESQLGIRSDISTQPPIPEEPMMTERERVKQEFLQAQQEIGERMKEKEEPKPEEPPEEPKEGKGRRLLKDYKAMEEEKARKKELRKQAKQAEKELKRLEAEAQKLIQQREEERVRKAQEDEEREQEKQRQKQIAEDIKKAGEAQKKLDEERRANAQKRREATRRKLDAIKSRQARTIQNAFRNKKAREIRDTLDNLITNVEFQVEEEETQRLIKEAEEEQKRIKTERARARREAFLKEEREKAIKLQKINDEVKGVLDDLVNNVELNVLKQETEAELAKAEEIRLEQQRQIEELTKQRELEVLNQRKKAEELIRKQRETIKNAKTEIEINDIQTEIDETTKHLKRIEETYKKIVKTNKQITEAGLDIITKGKIREIEFDADEFDKFIESIPNTKKVIDDTQKKITKVLKEEKLEYDRQSKILDIKKKNAMKIIGKVVRDKLDRKIIFNKLEQSFLNDEYENEIAKIEDVLKQQGSKAINMRFQKIRERIIKENEPSALRKGLSFGLGALGKLAIGTGNLVVKGVVKTKEMLDERAERLAKEQEELKQKELERVSAIILQKNVRGKLGREEYKKLLKAKEDEANSITNRVKNIFGSFFQSKTEEPKKEEPKKEEPKKVDEEERIRQAEQANIEREKKSIERQLERERRKKEEQPMGAKTSADTEREKKIKDLERKQQELEDQRKAQEELERTKAKLAKEEKEREEKERLRQEKLAKEEKEKAKEKEKKEVEEGNSWVYSSSKKEWYDREADATISEEDANKKRKGDKWFFLKRNRWTSKPEIISLIDSTYKILIKDKEGLKSAMSAKQWNSKLQKLIGEKIREVNKDVWYKTAGTGQNIIMDEIIQNLFADKKIIKGGLTM